ncbi:hypothetical protein WISP_50118 [Willisornis vidua]|uniref:Uncharacterized protein n=1 Tax=Willisornis vidua TaxID=1566151 RepID=A0ABQ9DEL1_9PASS|nr:hypothetical protein WISP_50118 [Willisornis vidua]
MTSCAMEYLFGQFSILKVKEFSPGKITQNKHKNHDLLPYKIVKLFLINLQTSIPTAGVVGITSQCGQEEDTALAVDMGSLVAMVASFSLQEFQNVWGLTIDDHGEEQGLKEDGGDMLVSHIHLFTM